MGETVESVRYEYGVWSDVVLWELRTQKTIGDAPAF